MISDSVPTNYSALCLKHCLTLQRDDEPERHVYRCESIELVVWLRRREVCGFELFYRVGLAHECSLRWTVEEGHSVQQVVPGSGTPPLMLSVENEQPPLQELCAIITRSDVAVQIREFISAHIAIARLWNVTTNVDSKAAAEAAHCLTEKCRDP